MSIGSISDVLTRISGIEQQLQSLQSGTLLDSTLGVSGGSSTSSSDSTTATTASGSSSSGDFADELAAAEQGDSSDTSADGSSDASSDMSGDATSDISGDATSAAASMLGDTASASGTAFGSLGSSALATSGYAGSLLSGASTSGVALSSSASSQLTSGQQQFASTLSADTGLNPSVVSAWLLSEESGGAAQSRQSANNNDWLNIGYTDSATYGASDSVWSDPTVSANATAAWLKGQDSITGYGTASTGIQSILASVGQTPQAQIAAIQNSGWSSGGYPDLAATYNEVSGGTATAV
ncbi:MAG TPA: hypothetical protein VHU61_02585 [Solirubrobacteraceae bacterium]|jgi:hypothetical protein|nr:hypothetical protein [Solirubrobacteraceae bacterium]